MTRFENSMDGGRARCAGAWCSAQPAHPRRASRWGARRGCPGGAQQLLHGQAAAIQKAPYGKFEDKKWISTRDER